MRGAGNGGRRGFGWRFEGVLTTFGRNCTICPMSERFIQVSSAIKHVGARSAARRATWRHLDGFKTSARPESLTDSKALEIEANIPEEFRLVPLSDWLPWQLRGRLGDAGIETVGDLRGRTRRDILSVHFIGPRKLELLEENLAERGIFPWGNSAEIGARTHQRLAFNKA